MMWFSLNIKDYVLKIKREENGFKIYISDLRSIWFEELKSDEIYETVQKLNPMLTFEASSKTLTKVLNLICGDEKVKKELKESGDEITLELSESMGKQFQFRFQLTLKKGDSNLFFNELTLPLLLIAKNMHVREKKLIDVIKSKDAEIAEYKIENVTIKRTHVITQPFIEKEFADQEESNSELVDVSKNPSQFFDKTCQNMLSKISEVIEITKREKIAQSSIIKQEQSSVNSNESPEKLNESEVKSNGEVKEEKKVVMTIGACTEIKKRKLQKNSSKLRI